MATYSSKYVIGDEVYMLGNYHYIGKGIYTPEKEDCIPVSVIAIHITKNKMYYDVLAHDKIEIRKGVSEEELLSPRIFEN